MGSEPTACRIVTLVGELSSTADASIWDSRAWCCGLCATDRHNDGLGKSEELPKLSKCRWFVKQINEAL